MIRWREWKTQSMDGQRGGTMAIDSLGGSRGINPVQRNQDAAAVDRVKRSSKAEAATSVDLRSKQFEPVVELARKQLSEADEIRLKAIKAQVEKGTYPVNPEEIARSMIEDRDFFTGLAKGDE
jgi:flagellar biosynthesis anti-sigma factor FlgM